MEQTIRGRKVVRAHACKRQSGIEVALLVDYTPQKHYRWTDAVAAPIRPQSEGEYEIVCGPYQTQQPVQLGSQVGFRSLGLGDLICSSGQRVLISHLTGPSADRLLIDQHSRVIVAAESVWSQRRLENRIPAEQAGTTNDLAVTV